MIRPLIAAEIPDALPLMEAYLKASGLPITFDWEKAMGYWLTLYAMNRGQLWGLYDQEELGGIMGVHLMDSMFGSGPGPDGTVGVNEWVWWVEPSHRVGTGGLKLLNEAEQWTDALGLHLLCGAYDALNGETMGKLYAKRGYVRIGSMYLRPCREVNHV